jgi:hypothetical protein
MIRFFSVFGERPSFGKESASPKSKRSPDRLVDGNDDLCSPSRHCGFSGYDYALARVRPWWHQRRWGMDLLFFLFFDGLEIPI